MNKKRLLIIDDEPEMLKSLEKILSRRPAYQLTLINDPQKALQLLSHNTYDLILTDLKMQKYSGMDILTQALKEDPGAKVIIITGYGTVETSVEAMRQGSYDFLEKPFTGQKLFDCLDRAFNAEDVGYSETIPEDEAQNFEGIIFKSEMMRTLLQMVQKVSQNNMSILVTGESGTGKELIARLIHKLSPRKHYPFVPVNCGALPENLFESEIFGYERGAFTGAIHTKPGLLEFTNQGSFFLDEIGDLSLNLQVKLLRMLEEKKIRRVGGTKEIELDVRIIAATNKSLENLVEKKLFREDLYYRLNTMKIEIPPLREHPNDILPLAHHFLRSVCLDNDGALCRFSLTAEKQLVEYSWPGNVRELQNAVNRAYFLRSATKIEETDLPLPINKQKCIVDDQVLQQPFKKAKEIILNNFESTYLTHHLKLNRGNISKTAETCGLDRRSIHRMVNKHNIIFKEK